MKTVSFVFVMGALIVKKAFVIKARIAIPHVLNLLKTSA